MLSEAGRGGGAPRRRSGAAEARTLRFTTRRASGSLAATADRVVFDEVPGSYFPAALGPPKIPVVKINDFGVSASSRYTEFISFDYTLDYKFKIYLPVYLPDS